MVRELPKRQGPDRLISNLPTMRGRPLRATRGMYMRQVKERRKNKPQINASYEACSATLAC